MDQHMKTRKLNRMMVSKTFNTIMAEFEKKRSREETTLLQFRKDGFLRHLKGLAPDVPDDFLRTIWASHLPSHMQVILASQTEGSLDSTSQLADKICEVTPQPTTASISPAATDNTARLLEHIEELSRQVTSLRASQMHSRSQSRDCHR
jgi:hypothetical protein